MLFQILKFKLILVLGLYCQISLAIPIDVANKIQNKFDRNLYKMRPINQSHYAIRLYRITGKKDYLSPIVAYQFIESYQLEYLLKKRPYFLEKFNAKFIHLPLNYESFTKEEKRKLLLAKFPGITNALKMLIILDHAHQVGILSSHLYSKAPIALNYIRKNIPFLRYFLLDSTVIKASSAQVANFIYLLERLNLIDLRKEFIKRFQSLFPETNDKTLSDKVFEDKIYGMTHIIFAASAYYQHELSPQEFSWIYNYFVKNIDRILSKTKPDVIAEVGLTFYLLHKATHSSALSKIKIHLAKQFDSEMQMISDRTGLDDLNQAEHRNVLTIMLFKWPSTLHSGPNLENSEYLLSNLEAIHPL
ncbi:MAG: DUF3541 domain-containing protein [Tatlockia sp.]|nr:DUF3541 domain-containing protein [Tatlockia sp.]